MSDVQDMQRDFWEAKVNKFILMFEYGCDTLDQFVSNMVHMGFEEEDILEALKETDDG
jgi:DNA-binding transcriptional regulator YhcF (GntR family)|tara:strand:- start:655 stop:828 length:174 start_codon:yes stop_codon:yes gene_type:complete